MKFSLSIILISFLVLSQISLGFDCPQKLEVLGNDSLPSGHQSPQSVSNIFSELQKVNSDGKTQLAHQNDFGNCIKPGGGGACASVTAFNMLQGLRVMAVQTVLDPKPVVLEAFNAIPELRDGRVTNPQMIQLLNHFEKSLAGRTLKVSAQNSPQTRPELREANGTVWNHFDGSLLSEHPNQLKMVVYAVHDSSGQYVGHHFVILKRTEANNHIVVVDPLSPEKELTYEYTNLPDPNHPETTLTRIARPGNIPHKLGWVLTLDTIFSVDLEPSKPQN